MPGTKKRTKKTKKRPKAISISIELSGMRVRIELGTAKLQEMLAAVLPQIIEQRAGKSEHDFDVVRRVIEIADDEVLEAIHTMTKGELERRQNAS